MLKYFQDRKDDETNIINYNIHDFLFRLRKVQNYCEKESVDGILVITGIHAYDNESYIHFINWLFLGYSGAEVLENDFLAHNLCNMILLVKADSVNIYTSRDGLSELQGFIYGIPNVKVFSPSEEEEQDENLCENIKLNFLMQIMQGINRVGVMLGKREEGKIKKIEKWPLIQGYALSELGKGFFSMNHEVVDLTQRFKSTLKAYDKHAFTQVVQGNSKRLCGHFNAAAQSISDIPYHKRQLITEKSLCEIIQDAYELEELSKYVTQDKELPKPRVLFGDRTNAEISVDSDDVMLKQMKEEDENNCIHGTFESVDLHSQVRAARTYFLKKNVKFEREIVSINDDYDVVQQYEVKEIENTQYPDEELLVNLYANLIISFQEIMQQVAKNQSNLNLVFIKQQILEKCNMILEQSSSTQQIDLENDIVVDLKCFDALGRQGPFKFEESNQYKVTNVLFVMRLQIKNIQSVIKPGKLLGSVLFCESFVLQEGCYLLLTKDIPYLQFFNTDNTYSKKIEDMKKRILYEPLGAQVNEWDPKQNKYKLFENNRMFIPSEKLTHFGLDIQIMRCNYMFHEKGLRIQIPQIGWILLYLSDMININFTSGLKSNWMIFQLENNVGLNALGRQTCCLEFKNEAVEQVMFKIRDYFDENQVKYGYIEGVPGVFETNNLAVSKILNKNEKKLIKMNQIYDEQFLFNYIQSRQNLKVNNYKEIKLGSFKNLNDLKENQVIDENKVGIVFINGGFNSGKRKFAQNLKSYSSTVNLRLFALEFDFETQLKLDTKLYINSVIGLAKTNKAKGGDLLLCPVPHWINTQKVIEYFGKNEKLSNVFFIRNVITKVNVNNFTLNNNLDLVPQVLTHCITGYSQAVVLDYYDNEESEIQNIQNIIKQVHPSQKIYRVMGNVIKSGLAKDMLEQSQYQNEYNIYNRQQLQLLYEYPSFQDFSVVFVPFTLPIDSRKLYNIVFKDLFKKKRGYMWKDEQLERKTKGIKEHYKNSTDDLAKDIVCVKEYMAISDLERQTGQIQYVKGLVRFDNKLKDGLYEITLNQNYFSQKKEKNIKVEVSDQVLEGGEEERTDVKKCVYSKFSNSSYTESNIGFLVCGFNLNEENLKNYFQCLWEEQETKKEFIKKEDLSHEEKKNIEAQNRDWPMEHGFFFDGHLFRDEDGLPLKFHPNIEEILDHHVSKENEEIQRFNDAINSRFNTKREFYNQIFVE